MFYGFLASLAGLALTLTVASGQRPSPCPGIFEYEKVELESGQWTGKVSLRTQEELTGIWLHIGLDNAANVLINWFGESTTKDNRAFVIKNPSKTLRPDDEPLEVTFRVQYDAASSVPSLQRIRLNGRTVCSTSTAQQPETSTVYISEKITEGTTRRSATTGRRPPSRGNSHGTTKRTPTHGTGSGFSSLSGGGGGSGGTTKEPEYFHAIQANKVSQSSSQCGRVVLKPRPLITQGQNTSEGEWPWHLAIYRSEGVYLTYICGGSLISMNYVLTAAHCVTKPRTNEASDLRGLLLYLGTTNIKQFGSGIQVHQAQLAHIHPEYNNVNLYNDIALLKLKSPAQFTEYVRPVCLWAGDTSIASLENKLGTVVGWGYDDSNKITDNLMQIKMPVVSLSTCLYSNREFFSAFTFEKNYCAGFRNGSSVCNGDSGGGMVFQRENDPQTWQLRGLVSIGVALQGISCDPSNFVIFTDVAKHLDWIKENMQ